jgi:hypothetical protein
MTQSGQRSLASKRFMAFAVGAFGCLLVLTSVGRTGLAFWLAEQLGMPAAELLRLFAEGPSRGQDYSGVLVRALLLLHRAGYQLIIGLLLVGIALYARRSGRLSP